MIPTRDALSCLDATVRCISFLLPEGYITGDMAQDQGSAMERLIIGGEKDRSRGGDVSREIAEKIPGAELQMCDRWGHGLYDEAKDFNQALSDFLRK